MELNILRDLERKVSWLSNYIIHYANNLRLKEDDLKVGGHQASCASVISILVVLYFKILNKFDRIAIKPHASPVFHAIQYLLNNQSLENLKNFRKINGAQAYPSLTKDYSNVDFSTGSVGLGGAMTIFSSIVQDYLFCNDILKTHNKSKMISVFGDAELDEGNVYEALLEGAKHEIENCWWIIDYNRQSLDGIIYEKLFDKLINLFKLMDWDVHILKYGKKLQRLKSLKGGYRILKWIDDCPNDLFSALTFQGGNAWRSTLKDDFNKNKDISNIIDPLNDTELHQLMTNLAGHDIEELNEVFSKNKNFAKPACFICYTVKGFGLPLAGHKDNHSGIMNIDQFNVYQEAMKIEAGKEWDKTEGLKVPKQTFIKYLSKNNFYNVGKERVLTDQYVEFAEKKISFKNYLSTQDAFGQIINDIGKDEEKVTKRIVTASPDVTVSTNLGSWVNQRNIFRRNAKIDIFKEKKVTSAQKWKYSPNGQHIELGIAENNLFLLLGALGTSENMFGTRLLPIGTIYDTFIGRGLDALNYATYINARFILVGTPSGVTLSHEGGAHQSIITPNIGISQPNLSYYEPSFADELNLLIFWALNNIQKKKGKSVYLRLSTKKLLQPKRELTNLIKDDIISGGYWFKNNYKELDLLIVTTGVIIGEVINCLNTLKEENLNIGVFVVTSPDELYKDWVYSTKKINYKSHLEKKLQNIDTNTPIISIIDGHSSALSWIGSVKGQKVIPMGVNNFGKSGDLKEVYELNEINLNSIVDRIARFILQ
ncbi:MAG: transketolase [Pelagibacterales bacterium]|nr:transketolase [Pelagibacterales bacterium]|tara:strand:+ start:3531 stop:5831 length:2301 start_codon:yes stop_codon:yes gene_type:complete